MTTAVERSEHMPDTLSQRLLAWYDRNARVLPWRAPPGVHADPYAVWLSEIMLQQTTVVVVAPYFRDFLEKWPTVADLAAAPLDDVLTAWAGLGYYARARNLHKCAVVVAEQYGGVFPDTESELLKLPGIGAYTAAAVSAIAFDKPSTILDGNVERVVARLRAVTDPLPGVKEHLRALAREITPQKRPGDYAQAIMDLGATVCTPRKPKCLLCPWEHACAGRHQGVAESLPAKTPKPERPTRRGVAYWIVRGDGAILIRRRPPKGLLGGMMEIPSTEWREEMVSEADARKLAPVRGVSWRPLGGLVRHTFTHFHLELTIMAGLVKPFAPSVGAEWVMPDKLGEKALPSVMRKVVNHALKKA
ncbi:MAG: A/G-specific adenine glycosylase [Pseudomonadota bacterium]